MKLDLTTRALTADELETLKAKLRALGTSHEASARALGVSPDTLWSALKGRRVQCAKREKLLEP